MGIKEPPKTGPKIAKWDIETSPMVVATFGLFDQNISIGSVIHDWFIICASWQWEGQDHINSVKLTDFPKRFKKDFRDDEDVVKAIHNMLMQADIIVAQNGDNFDIKKLCARAIYHKLPPLPYIPSVDTLKEARRTFKFTSNKLDYIGQFLTGEAKMDTPTGLWMKAMSGDREAIGIMSEYCDQDIVLLTKVYEALKPHMKNHPNMNVFSGGDYQCPTCQSPNIVRQGLKVTRAGKKQKWQCQACGAWSVGATIGKPVVIK